MKQILNNKCLNNKIVEKFFFRREAFQIYIFVKIYKSY